MYRCLPREMRQHLQVLGLYRGALIAYRFSDRGLCRSVDLARRTCRPPLAPNAHSEKVLEVSTYWTWSSFSQLSINNGFISLLALQTLMFLFISKDRFENKCRTKSFRKENV